MCLFLLYIDFFVTLHLVITSVAVIIAVLCLVVVLQVEIGKEDQEQHSRENETVGEEWMVSTVLVKGQNSVGDGDDELALGKKRKVNISSATQSDTTYHLELGEVLFPPKVLSNRRTHGRETVVTVHDYVN